MKKVIIFIFAFCLIQNANAKPGKFEIWIGAHSGGSAVDWPMTISWGSSCKEGTGICFTPAIIKNDNSSENFEIFEDMTARLEITNDNNLVSLSKFSNNGYLSFEENSALGLEVIKEFEFLKLDEFYFIPKGNYKISEENGIKFVTFKIEKI